MPWKNGKVTFADGTTYHAELLVEKGDEIWNVRIHKGNQEIEEIDAKEFAAKFGKTAGEVYPFTYNIYER
ncbi:MAG: hypothetical protein MJB12_07570 [Firmicutes bacterium]|nr:hypothetical protein [Bacillota bacterium]